MRSSRISCSSETAGVDGILSLGTTGEGMALSVPERKTALERYAAGPLPVIAHCGAQTTAQTVELAAHAASLGVEGVAVIAPPYFPLDEDELLAHFTAAALACAPTPFYAYELRARVRLRDPAGRRRAAPRQRRQRRRDEGQRRPVREGRAVPARRARRVHRRRGADRRRARRGRRRRRVGARLGASRRSSSPPSRAATRPRPASCGPRSTASRGTRR